MSYAVVARSYFELIADQPGLEILHRYPHDLLVRAESRPRLVPESCWQRTDETLIFVHGQAVEIRGGDFADHDHPHTLARFAGPVADPWRAELADRGIEVRFWCPPYGACLKLPPNLRPARLAELFPWIVAAVPYTRQLCSRGLPAPRAAGVPAATFDLVCFSRRERREVETALAAGGARVLDRSSCKIRVRFAGEPTALRAIRNVKLADPARIPVLLETDPLRNAVGLPAPAGAAEGTALTGRGQTIAIADTGLDSGVDDDSMHPDFRGRIAFIRSWPCNASWEEILRDQSDDGASDVNSGHGTHVAGLAAGDGTASGGRHRGLAPEARLVVQALEQRLIVKRAFRDEIPNGYYLSGRPLDLRELLREAHDAGARVHVYAWGDPTRGAYSDDCFEIDLFLHQHPSALVVCAAGNDGGDRNGDRVIDPGRLFAPAAAKNVVAIGATEGPVQGVGRRQTWGELDDRRFRSPADRRDPISGQPDRMALFSSAGPAADGRIKPELCAPGTNLAAVRSRRARGRGWGMAGPAPFYMYNGGTSSSAGVAGGGAACLRQAWQEHLGEAPSGAALKALLVLGAAPVRRRDDGGVEARHAAGFGRLQLAAALPGDPHRPIALVDHRRPGLQTGERLEWAIEHPGGPFRAVLAWYDAPAEVLVNDLDLSLSDGASFTRWGNHPPGKAGEPDSVNTVERVAAGDLPAGEYRLRVRAANVPEGPQPFALAWLGPAPAAEGGGEAVRTELAAGALLDVEDAVRARLRQRDLHSVSELMALDPGELADATGLGARRLAGLSARLELLARLRATEPLAEPLLDQRLETLLHGQRPPAQDAESWRDARRSALLAVLIFRPSVHAALRLREVLNP